MRAFALPLLLAFAAGPALGQTADPRELDTISEIGRCLVQGLPEDWAAAHMVLELERPGAASGNVRYLVARKDVPERLESFQPCDTQAPAHALVELRERQPEDRRGWTAARLVFERDGSFRLSYDFPK